LLKQQNSISEKIFLGKHIRLVDRKWAIAVEQAIGNLLSGFLCSCREDERIFLEILSRCVPAQDMDYRPSITGKYFFFAFCFSQFYFLVMKYQSQVYQKLRVNIFFYILKFKITLNFSYLHRVLQQFYPCLILIIQQLHVI